VKPGDRIPLLKRAWMRAKPSDFVAGDLVIDIDEPDVLGIVTEVRERGVSVCWENGGRISGPGALDFLKHLEPRIRIVVPRGTLGYRGWNREQAVKAALRRVGL
jgi:hypothetical protein